MPELPKRILLAAAPPRAGAVCRSCRHHIRQFASSTPPPPKPPPAGLAALPSRQLISLTGPDAAKFLQGIITSSVVSKGQPRTEACYTGFLNATGRVLHDVFLYPYQNGPGLPEGGTADPSFLIEVDSNQANVLAKYLKRYKLRSKLSLKTLSSSEASVWQAWDDAGEAILNPTTDDSRIIFRDPRAPGMGHRIIQFNDKTPQFDLEQSTEDAYTIRRYLRGIAEGQDEILREHALPQESNMDMTHGIDWNKGCYVGQELTIRTKHRGVVRKRILPCVVYEKDKAAPQSLTYDPESDFTEALTADMIPAETSIGRYGKRGRSAGKWLKGVGNIGLGLCRLEIMTDVVLPGEQAAASFTPESEFLMEWGEEDNKSAVKVKAFVPEWLRSSLSQS